MKSKESEDDREHIRWSNTLKRWREPILNHCDNGTTNGFTEGCNTQVKMLKRVSFGLRDVEVYLGKCYCVLHLFVAIST